MKKGDSLELIIIIFKFTVSLTKYNWSIYAFKYVRKRFFLSKPISPREGPKVGLYRLMENRKIGQRKGWVVPPS